jgi:glycosyltransferase involved in cell wall biosynthesis
MLRKNANDTILYIVVPCYNEEKVLPITPKMFLDELNILVDKGLISNNSRILFVDDGSKDSTWDLIKEYAVSDEHYIGIAQSRNRGHQNAVLAGLMEAYESGADITISIDCDGQDDVSAMEDMVKEYHDGCEIVYGVRNSRKTDTFFKRKTAEGFYRLMNSMGAEVVYNHADYRLLSRRVLNELKNYREVNLFLRGMVPLVGFKSTSVYYVRQERIAGRTHYPLSKMMGLAFDGITSMSIKPIRLIMILGVIVAILSFAGIVWAVVSSIVGKTVAGWASTVCIVCFLSGVQMVSIGVIGEYIGKIYMEVKDRPRYIISERTYEGDEENIKKDC